MRKSGKTAYLSINLGSCYEVRISNILDQGNWDINTYSIKKFSFFTIHVVSLMIMLPWYTVYIIVGLERRNTCMDFYALGRITW